jgi:hypothetical protein
LIIPHNAMRDIFLLDPGLEHQHLICMVLIIFGLATLCLV